MNTEKQYKSDETLCATLGTIGAALSATCLYQHLMFMIPFWVTYILAFIYLFAFICYILLAKRNRFAPLLIIVVAICMFLDSILLLYTVTISPIVLLFTGFNIISVLVIFTVGLPKRLNQYYLQQKEEDAYWEDKI
ncbi:MAG: hypothetical protein ACOVNY_00430 [Chitinophagaceae bacterium]